ncbi:hypothetical protein ABNK63_12560 [Rhodanobacter sp. IGA1.0]|uniref:Uncharacterized protein n=1 Tax=Rhodanobacter sp. IGA1.0 TaxID=3158582 RepID=A0AAU7QIQ5_9GAMM
MAGITLLSVIVSGVLQWVASAPYAAGHPSVYTGVYAIRFCHGPCTAVASAWDRTGTLVLSGHPLLNQRSRRMRQSLEREPVNGCLLLDAATTSGGHGPFDPDTLRRRWLTWSTASDGNAVSFAFERSPDDASWVELKLSAVGLTGHGYGFDFAPGQGGPEDVERDGIVATRTGSFDAGSCASPPVHHAASARDGRNEQSDVGQAAG